MSESEKSISSSKDSNNITDSKLNETNGFNEISAQEVINNEFDNLEDWIDEQFENIKKKCLEQYNNFKVNIPNQNQKKDIESSSLDEESY